jgi:hypothetical protein
MQWIEQAARVLKPTGTLFICGFSEILADLKHPATKYFKSCRWIIWHYKNKANLGKDWGRSHESILHFRKTKNFTFNIDEIRIPYGEHTLKYPSHPQAETSQYGNGKNGNHIWEPNPLGAKPKDILYEFLIEAVLLTLLGGVLGVFLGTALSFLVAVAAQSFGMEWKFIVPISGVVIGVGVAGLIGLVFGVLPARNAAKLDPIEALRAE